MLLFSFSCICHISCLDFYCHNTWGRGFQSLIMLSLLLFLEGLQVAQNLHAEEKRPPSPSSFFLCLKVSALVLGALFPVPVFRGTLIRQNSASRFPFPLHGAPQHWDTSLHFVVLKPEGKALCLGMDTSRELLQSHRAAAQPKQGAPVSLHELALQGGKEMVWWEFPWITCCTEERKKRDGKILPRNMPQGNSEKSLVAYYGFIQKAFSKLWINILWNSHLTCLLYFSKTFKQFY